MLPSHWKIAPQETSRAAEIAQALNILPLTAQLLINRGMTNVDSARAFLSPALANLPDPHELPDMGIAATRIANALERNESIAVYGDYDVDGLTSTALLMRILRSLGATPRAFIPHRQLHGYGLHPAPLEELAHDGVKLVITVDTGSTAHAALTRARELHLDVIVTDHHELDERLPPALALVNPQRLAAGHPMRVLCGCGVAFFVAMALRRELRMRGNPAAEKLHLGQMLDLVALATIADVVPLIGCNRILVSHGLKLLAKHPIPGIAALMRMAQLTKLPPSARDLAFRIAPRLNAAGRIGDATPALELLLTDDADVAWDTARLLEGYNAQRSQVEGHVFEQALVQAHAQLVADPNAAAITVYSAQWHVGVVGIVAAKLAERFSLPVAVIGGENPAKGSLRTARGVHLAQAIEACRKVLISGGGHAAAAGITISPEHIDSFRQQFSQACTQQTPEHLPIAVDALIPPTQLTEQLVTELNLLAPFGAGNPEPLFAVSGMQLIDARIVGEKHLAFRALHDEGSLKAIAWGWSKNGVPPQTLDSWCLAGCPHFDDWRGERRIQLHVQHMHPEASPPNC